MKGSWGWIGVIYERNASVGWSLLGISPSGCQFGVCKEEVHWSKIPVMTLGQYDHDFNML